MKRRGVSNDDLVPLPASRTRAGGGPCRVQSWRNCRSTNAAAAVQRRSRRSHRRGGGAAHEALQSVIAYAAARALHRSFICIIIRVIRTRYYYTIINEYVVMNFDWNFFFSLSKKTAGRHTYTKVYRTYDTRRTV